MIRDIHADTIDGRSHFRHLNRIRGKAAQKYLFWCIYCDGALVGQIGKCPRCHKRQGHEKRNIRPIDFRELEIPVAA